jgi:carboxypeptidase Taq
MGVLIAAQMWDRLEEDLGAQDDALATGDVQAIRTWLADHVHRHGRRLDTEALITHATGRALSIDPFVAHAAAGFRAGST